MTADKPETRDIVSVLSVIIAHKCTPEHADAGMGLAHRQVARLIPSLPPLFAESHGLRSHFI